MEFQDLRRICHALYSHLGSMDEAVLLDSDIHESAEGGNVRHYSRKLHTGLYIFYGLDVMGEFKCLCRFARVAARLLELKNDVIDGRKTECRIYIS